MQAICQRSAPGLLEGAEYLATQVAIGWNSRSLRKVCSEGVGRKISQQSQAVCASTAKNKGRCTEASPFGNGDWWEDERRAHKIVRQKTAGAASTRKPRVRMEEYCKQQAQRARSRPTSNGAVVVKRSEGEAGQTWWETFQVTTLEELNLGYMSPAAGTSMEEGAIEELSQTKGTSTVLVKLHIMKAGAGLFVKGSARSIVLRQCHRCSKNFAEQVDAPFEVWLSSSQDTTLHAYGKGQDNDDPSVIYLPAYENVADLTDTVHDAIAVSLPMQAVCSEQCRRSRPSVLEVEGAGLRPDNSRWLRLKDLL